MMLLTNILCSLSFLFNDVSDSTQNSQPNIDKKIYADYHVTRLNREHSGNVGVWKYRGVAKSSELPHTAVNYNPDLIDSRGRHQIASREYPVVGMQSELDPEYLEYQILSAKIAHIDGMMVEWGHKEHTGNYQLLAMIEAAKKFDFEVGVNWCVGWINQTAMGLKNREEFLAYFKENLLYLRDSIYNDQTGVNVNGRPVILLFAGDVSNAEFENVIADIRSSANFPIFLRQQLTAGQLQGDTMKMDLISSDWYDVSSGFSEGISGYFSWIPTRARTRDSRYPHWDRYALPTDATLFLDALHNTKLPNIHTPLRLSSAVPGFDNRSCASWNKGDLSFISRKNFQTYRNMWAYNIENSNRFDWVYIPTWNDWTEDSHIEPSETDKGLALQLTQQYGAAYKNLPANPELLDLPRQLFELRKKIRKLQAITKDEQLSSLGSYLDACAQAIASLNSVEAKAHLQFVNAELDLVASSLSKPKKVVVSHSGRNKYHIRYADNKTFITLDDALVEELNNHYYEAHIDFGYRSSVENSTILIKGEAAKPSRPYGNFGIIANINTDKSMQKWRKGRVRVFQENIVLKQKATGDAHFSFECATDESGLRDIKLTFTIYPRN